MTWTVVAGIHYYEFARQIVRAPESSPALCVKAHGFVMRPRRNHVELFFRNSLRPEALLYKPIEDDDLIRAPQAAVEQRAQTLRGERARLEPAGGDRLVRIQIHHPEDHPAALEPHKPGRQPRDEWRRSQRDHHVLARPERPTERAGNRKAGKVEHAGEARFLDLAGRP